MFLIWLNTCYNKKNYHEQILHKKMNALYAEEKTKLSFLNCKSNWWIKCSNLFLFNFLQMSSNQMRYDSKLEKEKFRSPECGTWMKLIKNIKSTNLSIHLYTLIFLLIWHVGTSDHDPLLDLDTHMVAK